MILSRYLNNPTNTYIHIEYNIFLNIEKLIEVEILVYVNPVHPYAICAKFIIQWNAIGEFDSLFYPLYDEP